MSGRSDRRRGAPRPHRPRTARARRNAGARPGALREAGARARAPARAAQVRGRVRDELGSRRAAAWTRARRLHRLRQDRPHRRRPFQRAGHRPGLQARPRARRARYRDRAEASDPALHPRASRPRGHGAARRAVPRPHRDQGGARPRPRRGAGRGGARAEAARLPLGGRLLAPGRRGSGPRPRCGRSGPRWRCAHRSSQWRVPALVLAMDYVQGPPLMRSTPSDQQVAALEEPGVVFVSAGAGTGKTTVLVERFVKAVCERGLGIDNVLVITYTERAAGELRTRIRERLVEAERHDLARDLDGGWISTIHGFCHRLLRAHPFEAGLDPRFRVLDESQAAVLRSEAFAEALGGYVEAGHPERVRLLATYGAEGLRGMLTSVYDRLRSAGRPLELPGEPVTSLPERAAQLRLVAENTLSLTEESLPGRTQVEDALQLLDPVPPTEDLLDLSDLRVGGEERERFASFGEALAAVEQAALDEIAARDRTLLEELLGALDTAYGEAKARESALDFEDLQLRARNLLQLDEKVRDDARWRFRSILVDEFQDTNRLQCELVDLIAGDEVFFVGDEVQSIYRFRHADVEVFRERRAASSGVLPLTENYRSRPEVLEVVNHLFGAEFGAEYEPLVAAGRFPDPIFGPPVELLVTDKASYREGDVHWRIAEARHVASRVRELVDSGQAAPGDIVLLFAAGTDAERYEEALRLENLPTYRAAGRGYFGQQQVADLTMYLRLILNRYDDEALVSVLASPFVGVSNDALYLLRRAAGKRPLFSGMERDLPAELGPRDRRLFEAFRQRYDRLVRAAATAGLERLCERIVSEHDYDLAVLARWDGRRRYANLRKLARLARSYEELRGPEIEGFLRFVADQESFGARELEAVAEEEGADVVRLLTIHAAKGLEFKVGIVADAGRDAGGPPSADEILALSDGRFGFRMVHPTRGDRRPVFGYEEVRDASAAQERAERLRLYYVAMTRAVDRLIVSGAIDADRESDRETPIGWVIERLDVSADLAAAGEDPVELERRGSRWLVRVDRHRPVSEQAPVEPATDPESVLEQGQL